VTDKAIYAKDKNFFHLDKIKFEFKTNHLFTLAYFFVNGLRSAKLRIFLYTMIL